MFVRIVKTKEVRITVVQEVESLEEGEEIAKDIAFDSEDVDVDFMEDIVEEISEAEYLEEKKFDFE